MKNKHLNETINKITCGLMMDKLKIIFNVFVYTGYCRIHLSFFFYVLVLLKSDNGSLPTHPEIFADSCHKHVPVDRCPFAGK